MRNLLNVKQTHHQRGPLIYDVSLVRALWVTIFGIHSLLYYFILTIEAYADKNHIDSVVVFPHKIKKGAGKQN